MARADLDVLDRMCDVIRYSDTHSVLAMFGVDSGVAAHCSFDHGAVLVFPESSAPAPDALRAHGLDVGDMVPSVVVRGRLLRRYGVTGLQVGILRAPVGDAEIEIFTLTGAPADVVAAEREHQHEAHFALSVTSPDDIVLSGLTGSLREAGLVPDGGGYNSHVDCTVLYFRGGGQRLELISEGQHEGALKQHLREDPAYRLLEVMTGAWRTQAVAVAASLRLADHLAAGKSIEDISADLDLHRDSLRRLLRYLAGLGVLRADGDTFALTALGELLRTDVPNSLQPLAVLYGGSFYQSFGALEQAVRTGRESFERVFGKHHFDYFAERPALGFNRAMAASATIFGQVAEAYDFTAARHVVDVAGGSGELLRQVLHATPHLRGTLLERSDVLPAARANLTECLDRCSLVAGDFTSAVPVGGDVYLLSRVLHDWDDQQCLAILKRCASAMRPGTELLVVERLLPEDDSPSLAMAWDVHMLCNVGGRERTLAHYRRLLGSAGFTVTSATGLPLDFSLVAARIG
ncbi:acetylserotonin O-methyltransferase [Kibdelosporangium phytohabitans]|uniref:acetylserotonin O-methyltransferase n=1 Tax=Kibdelosporangium phytohabitans TaxID=860235 RepID=UPI0019EA6795|nr:acetylserotonin O-methyltransferase [Kibdelosporangium phytohabitans]MBE1465261.1 hypothetical protein [Kibdelosporangium phytohabitans]